MPYRSYMPHRKLQWNCNGRHCGKLTNGGDKYCTTSMFSNEGFTTGLAASREKNYQQKLTQFPSV